MHYGRWQEEKREERWFGTAYFWMITQTVCSAPLSSEEKSTFTLGEASWAPGREMLFPTIQDARTLEKVI